MVYLKLPKSKVQPATINAVAGSLERGEVAVLPTDTIYGFSCRADRAAAIRRVYGLKRRESRKPLIVLVSSLAMARKFVHISASQAAYLRKYWLEDKRPTTVILFHRGLLPRELSGDSDGLALRLPKSIFLIKILRKIKQPLVSTSLNLSGESDIRDLEQFERYWPGGQEQPDLVVDAGPVRRRKASRLIDLRTGKPDVLRK